MKSKILKIIREEFFTEKTDFSKEKDKGLHGWFERQGGSGKSSGWVDCNTCKKDPDTGRKKCKPCGREDGEKRSKYPACRPTPSACGTKGKGSKWGKKTKNESISESVLYHIENRIPLTENVYRYGSEGYFNLINETRELYLKGEIELSYLDEELIKTDIGKKGVYEGEEVWLDILYEEEEELINEAEYQGKKVQLNKPKRGGSKKFYVYTKCGGKVKKVSFGAKSGGGTLAVKLRDPKARKAFADRHNCPQKKDKCSAGYWACRLPRYAKSLGLSGGGTWW